MLYRGRQITGIGITRILSYATQQLHYGTYQAAPLKFL
jgi:hypothetical protein